MVGAVCHLFDTRTDLVSPGQTMMCLGNCLELSRENRSAPKVVSQTDFGCQKSPSPPDRFWSPNGPPLIANSGPSRTKLATQTGPGDCLWQPKVIRHTCLGCDKWSCFPRYMQVMYRKHINRNNIATHAIREKNQVAKYR